MTRVTIDGNICSGKSHYLTLLERAKYHVHCDTLIGQSELVQKYKSDMKRYSLSYHLQLLHNYAHFPHAKNELHIYEGSPYTVKNVYSQLLYEKDCFDLDEYKIYNVYVEDLGWMPDVIIYLFCNPIVCYERNKLRQTTNNVSLDYLKDLHLKYETTFDELNCPITIYKVNAQEEDVAVYKNIVDILDHLDAKTS